MPSSRRSPVRLALQVLAFLVAACWDPALAQPGAPVVTVDGLGSCAGSAPSQARWKVVTDGAAAGDCTTGGGLSSHPCWCLPDGAGTWSWRPLEAVGPSPPAAPSIGDRWTFTGSPPSVCLWTGSAWLRVDGSGAPCPAPDPWTLPASVLHVEARFHQATDLSRCTTQACYDAVGESTPAASSWCDLTPAEAVDGQGTPALGLCGAKVSDTEGPACVRFAVDRSPSAWPFAMDDPEKPCHVPDCDGALPCLRGMEASGAWARDAALELPSAQWIELAGDFAAYARVRRIAQTSAGVLAGAATSWLALQPTGAVWLRTSAHNGDVSPAGVVPVDTWALVEVHRQADQVTVIVDGVPSPPVTAAGTWIVQYLLDAFKGTSGRPFTGDLSALSLFTTAHDDTTRQMVRAYLTATYGSTP